MMEIPLPPSMREIPLSVEGAEKMKQVLDDVTVVGKEGYKMAEVVSPLGIRGLCAEANKTATEKGWWSHPRSFGDQIALMHSELSEALEVWRVKGFDPSGFLWFEKEVEGGTFFSATQNRDGTLKPEGIAAEFADVLIRIFDTCGQYGIDLERALQEKMAYNKTRSFRHGGKLS